MNIFLAVILGGFFGFALYFVGATANVNIIKMLRLEDMTLAKIILFAIGFSSVLLSISGMSGILNVSHLHVKSMNLGVILGGLIFGIGFGSAGTCPGTCIGAIGGISGMKRAVIAVLGGLFGAFVFSISYKYFYNIGIFNILDYGKIMLFKISTEYDSVLNIGFSGLFFIGILFMLAAYYIPQEIIKNK